MEIAAFQYTCLHFLCAGAWGYPDGHGQGTEAGAQVASTPGDSPEEKGVDSARWQRREASCGGEATFQQDCKGWAGPGITLTSARKSCEAGFNCPKTKRIMHREWTFPHQPQLSILDEVMAHPFLGQKRTPPLMGNSCPVFSLNHH